MIDTRLYSALVLAACVACGSSSPSGQSPGGASSSVAGASAIGGDGVSGTAGELAGAGAGTVSGSDAGGTVSAMAGSDGTTAGGAPSVGGAEAGASASGAGGSSSGRTRVLIYCVTTGFRHESIPEAAKALAGAVRELALTSELVGCGNDMNRPDPTKLTSAALAEDGAVVLLANSGEPFGYPATTEIQNLIDYVRQGGALVAIEDADHCYDGAVNGHPASDAYVNLIGNDFVGHPGGVARATCTTMGNQASVSQLAPAFTTTDEIYETTKFRLDNQVVLSCKANGNIVRPVSYIREEGAGRVFFTALGHRNEAWTKPMDAALTNTRLVQDHVIPGMLWAMGRR